MPSNECFTEGCTNRASTEFCDDCQRGLMTNAEYDYETTKHINRVKALAFDMLAIITDEVGNHDASKLVEPERSAFRSVLPRLSGSTYGSEDYKAALLEIRPAIKHHNKVNRHHPKHFDSLERGNGVDGMNLMDVIHMLADWKAASERHDDADFNKSLEISCERFKFSEQLKNIFMNTCRDMGWI